MRLEGAMARVAPRYKLVLAAVRAVRGPQDIFRVHMHRPELFGGPFGEAVHAHLRGPSEWSVAEREAFAAHVSRGSGCSFCTRAHETFATAAAGAEGARALLGEAGPQDPRVRAAFALIDALRTQTATRAHVEALRKVGVSAQGIEDVIGIAALFTTINRIADALQFDVPPLASFQRMAPMRLRVGYRVPFWKA